MITGGILAVYVLGTFLQWKVSILYCVDENGETYSLLVIFSDC